MPSPDAIVIVHAGVGRRSELSAREVSELCERAAHGGRLVGCATGDPTAAVVEAIRILEESPYTNAGTGANVNRECVVECDASLIEGWSQRGGSVGAVPSVSNAILITQKMVSKPKSPACLVGPGALSWFRANGGEMPEKELITGQQRKMYAKYMAGATTAARAKATPATETPSQAPGGSGESESSQNKFRMDTVGAIALVRGRIAAGVSSGGIFLKHPGRVGQAGVYGAGCWANRTVGVSTSGSGEHLIRTMLASRCVAALDTAVKKKPDDGDGNSEIEDLPPAMKLKVLYMTTSWSCAILYGRIPPLASSSRSLAQGRQKKF
ncbi:threonine aspartase 1-like isoform X2 [Varroa jacobsoni]|uniref:Asparaginase n=1 Tax=Varroa destructor TaxID=109461 RepID=A0A7M7MDS1_VARDE|nr:threonine aspartase 1-like isoform X2 [Varroa destructor]XP_022706206.1 threonine aspartase 1-like isoform X2 [Varroa jacobsoni]